MDRKPGLELVFSGVPSPFFNMGFTTDRIVSADHLETLVLEAKAWAAQFHVPWFFALTTALLADGVDANQLLGHCGMTPAMTLAGMVTDDVEDLEWCPESLDLKRADDDASCSALMEVNGAAYGMDLAALHCAMSKSSFWREQFPVLGTVDGKPASCSAVMMVDGLRYVALVATMPHYQRRGFADAAMRRSLALAAEKHGRVPTLLHATEAGKPVYERMGYRSIATHTREAGTRALRLQKAGSVQNPPA